jgi:hypothetical protein
MQTLIATPEIIWRVWVLPGADTWKLASGAEMKANRDARKVSLDEERYARLLAGRLPLHERLEAEREELVPAA